MENIVHVAIETLMLLTYLLFFIVIGGIVIKYLEEKSNRNLYKSIGYTGVYITGLGTIVHELSHLICVIITFMKPTEVKLFRPIKAKQDGRLGYVEYTYNNNWFHRMSLVLVGIAPIIGGTMVILISMKLLLPSIYSYLSSGISYLVVHTDMLSKSFMFEQMHLVYNFMIRLFSIDNMGKLSFWIFLFIVVSIASHMSLSKADINGAKQGVLTLYMVLFFINIILYIIGYSSNEIVHFYSQINLYIAIFMILAIVFSFINLIFTFLLSKVFHKY